MMEFYIGYSCLELPENNPGRDIYFHFFLIAIIKAIFEKPITV